VDCKYDVATSRDAGGASRTCEEGEQEEKIEERRWEEGQAVHF
jgi:hypothetical protein